MVVYSAVVTLDRRSRSGCSRDIFTKSSLESSLRFVHSEPMLFCSLVSLSDSLWKDRLLANQVPGENHLLEPRLLAVICHIVGAIKSSCKSQLNKAAYQ